MFRLSMKWGLLLCGVLGLVGPASAQAVFSEKTKDLGAAARGAILNHTVKITNRYNQELHVSGLRTSCGVCSSASMDKATLAPGESADLQIRIDTNKYAGHRNFTVYVTFDRPVIEEQSVSVTAVSRDDVMMSPSALAFGSVRCGSSPTAQTTIDYRGGVGNWAILGTANDNGFLKPDVKEVRRQFGQVSYQVSVRLEAGLPVGSWHTDLWLKTNDPAAALLRVPITVEVQPPVMAVPQSLDLGQIAKGGAQERKIVLRSDKPFLIKEIEGLDASVQVSGQSPEPKEVQVIRVTYQANAKPGQFEKKLRFITDMQGAAPVAVTLRGSQSQ